MGKFGCLVSQTAAAALAYLTIVAAATEKLVQKLPSTRSRPLERRSTRILLEVSGSFDFRSERRGSDRPILTYSIRGRGSSAAASATKKFHGALVKDLRIGEARQPRIIEKEKTEDGGDDGARTR